MLVSAGVPILVAAVVCAVAAVVAFGRYRGTPLWDWVALGVTWRAARRRRRWRTDLWSELGPAPSPPACLAGLAIATHYDDGKPIWGDFDAQEIFNHLRGDLRIRPCNIGFAAYYESMGRVDLMDAHPDEKPLFISGSKVREALTAGQRPDPRVLRPEIADILIDYYTGKAKKG